MEPADVFALLTATERALKHSLAGPVRNKHPMNISWTCLC